MPYTAHASPTPSAESLRERIPGWGSDLDPADRPAYPRERFDPDATGAHWELPPQQPEPYPRERSIEHGRLTPAFGTSVGLKGLSGVVRRQAYRHFSEGRAAHWVLLLAADRIDVVESHAASLLTRRPDNPVLGTGLRAELSGNGLASRRGSRSDVNHQWMDPFVVAGPWVLGGWGVVRAVRRLRERR